MPISGKPEIGRGVPTHWCARFALRTLQRYNTHYILRLLRCSAIPCFYRRFTGRKQGRLRAKRNHILWVALEAKSPPRAAFKMQSAREMSSGRRQPRL